MTCLEPPNTVEASSRLLLFMHTHLFTALQCRLDAHHFCQLLLQLSPQFLHFKLLLFQLRQQNVIHLHSTATLEISIRKRQTNQPSCQLPALFDPPQTTAAVWSSPPLPGSAGWLTASSRCLHSVSTLTHLMSSQHNKVLTSNLKQTCLDRSAVCLYLPK